MKITFLLRHALILHQVFWGIRIIFLYFLLQVGYQNILQLSYIDKLLTDIQLEFRDRYKNRLEHDLFSSFDFDDVFIKILMDNEESSKNKKREMKSFEDSNKAKKIMKQRGQLELSTKKDEKKAKNNDSNGKYYHSLSVNQV